MDPELEAYDAEEHLHNKPFLVIQPSLEYLAARTVTISLLQNTINRLKVEDNFFGDSCTIPLVQRFIKTLEVPECCECKLLTLLKITCHQIRLGSFLMYQRNFTENPSTLENYQTYVYLKNIVWTSNGSIDLNETAKSIVKSGLLTDEERYAIACRHRITEAIRELAPKIVSQSYLDKVDAYFDPLIFFWSCCANGQMDRLNRFPLVLYTYSQIRMDWRDLMLNFAVWNSNLVAHCVSHFRQVLSPNNRGYTEHYYHELSEITLRLQRTMFEETSFEYSWKRLPKEERYELLCKKAWCLDSLASDSDAADQRDELSTNGYRRLLPPNNGADGRNDKKGGTIKGIREHLLLPQLSPILRRFLERIQKSKAIQPTTARWVHVPQQLPAEAFTNQQAELRRPSDPRTLDYLAEEVVVVLQSAEEASTRRISKSEYGKYVSCVRRACSTEELDRERGQFTVQQRQNSEEPAENERCTKIVIERDAELGNGGCSTNANSRNSAMDAPLCDIIIEYLFVMVIFCTTFLVLPFAVTVVITYCFSRI